MQIWPIFKGDMHGNQAAPVTRRVLAEGVRDGYFYIPQKRPHSLDRESFTKICPSQLDSLQSAKPENSHVAMFKHVTPFPQLSALSAITRVKVHHLTSQANACDPSYHFTTTKPPTRPPQWQPQSQPSMPKSAPNPSYPTSALHVRAPPPTFPRSDIR